MNYIDTSLLVAAFTSENETARAQDWMRRNNPASFVISDWTITEFSAALAMKLRNRLLAAHEQEAAETLFKRSFRGAAVESVGRSDFRAAASLSSAGVVGLRAGDALHVAIAQRLGATLWTLDRDLQRAATERKARASLP